MPPYRRSVGRLVPKAPNDLATQYVAVDFV